MLWQADEMAHLPEPLAVQACRSLCRWVPTRTSDDLFACQGCGSQWRPGEPWTPIDADGAVPVAVRRARDRLTSARRGAGAGTSGR